MRQQHGNGTPRAASSPQRRTVDRGDHRFRARLDGVDHLGEGGTDRRLAEFGDIGARKECAPSQVMTTALMASSEAASAIAAANPARTAWPSALTGGLFDVTTSTSPSLRVLMTVIPISCFRARCGTIDRID